MSQAFGDATAAVERIVDLSRRGQLPFAFTGIGPREDGSVEITLTPIEADAARAYFDERPLARVDGSPIAVDLVVSATASWTSWPVGGVRRDPDPGVLDELIGMDVNVAALRANASGWLVRAYQPHAVLTADLRTNRADLRFSESGEVTDVRVG